MHNTNKWGTKLIISLFAFVCIVGGTIACDKLANHDLHAADVGYTEDIQVEKLIHGRGSKRNIVFCFFN